MTVLLSGASGILCGPHPPGRREPPAPGARRRLPRRSGPPAVRPQAREHGHRQMRSTKGTASLKVRHKKPPGTPHTSAITEDRPRVAEPAVRAARRSAHRPQPAQNTGPSGEGASHQGESALRSEAALAPETLRRADVVAAGHVRHDDPGLQSFGDDGDPALVRPLVSPPRRHSAPPPIVADGVWRYHYRRHYGRHDPAAWHRRIDDPHGNATCGRDSAYSRTRNCSSGPPPATRCQARRRFCRRAGNASQTFVVQAFPTATGRSANLPCCRQGNEIKCPEGVNAAFVKFAVLHAFFIKQEV